MRFLIFSVLMFVVFTLGAIGVRAETFNTNLTVGSRGPDVITLQQFLVSKRFLVMPAGVSYGYFGILTKAAVARWQEANGISPALGYFGPISRGVIANQVSTSTTPHASSILPNVGPDTLAAVGMRTNRVFLFRATPFEVRPGDSLTLDGSGFSKTLNKIYFNGSELITATSADGTKLMVRVPENLTEGEYRLSVSNVLGSSDNPDIKIAIKVTSNPQQGPTITSASIAGDTVTLVGAGFTSSNKLFTTLGDSSSPISSNGTTLTFRITDLSRYNRIKTLTKGKYQASLWIYVQNEHGISANPYELKLII